MLGFAGDVEELVTRKDLLTKNRHGALTSLAYNIGVGGLAESTALHRFNEGDLSGAAEAIGWWNKVNGVQIEGLNNRRLDEIAWFNTEDAGGLMRYPTPLSSQYLLINLGSSFTLDELAPEDGALAYMGGLHAGANQKWAQAPLDDGWFAVVNIQDGRCLSIGGGSTDEGALAVVWPWHGGDDQRWKFEEVAKTYGLYHLRNKKSGKILAAEDLSNGSRCTLIDADNLKDNRDKWTGAWCLSSPLPPNDPEIIIPPLEPPDPVDKQWALEQILSWQFETEHNIVWEFQRAFAFWDIAIDAQLGDETARAVKMVSDRGGLLSEHFHMDEMRSKGNGLLRCNRRLLQGLERVREQTGSVSIISGYRDPDRNAAVGGATNSQHLYGNAADVSLPYDVARGVNSFSGIGIVESDGSVAHVDVRHDGPNTTGGTPENPTIWYYA